MAAVCGAGLSQAECLWIKLDGSSESRLNDSVSLRWRKLCVWPSGSRVRMEARIHLQ